MNSCLHVHESPMRNAPKKPKVARHPTRNNAQRQAILDAASILFIQKGFGGTNINDIADAVGMTRTALYYYFPSKESLLETLTREITQRASDLTKEVAQRAELPPEESLRQLIVQHATLILEHPLQFRVVERSESSLPQAQRKTAQTARRAVRDDFVAVIQRGISLGKFHPVDAEIAAFSIIGMCNWTAWWSDRRRTQPVAPVAELIATLGLRMLRADTAGSTQAHASAKISRALTDMRAALTQLESGLAGKV